MPQGRSLLDELAVRWELQRSQQVVHHHVLFVLRCETAETSETSERHGEEFRFNFKSVITPPEIQQ